MRTHPLPKRNSTNMTDTDTCERRSAPLLYSQVPGEAKHGPTSSQQRSDDEHNMQRSHVVLDYYRSFTRLAVRTVRRYKAVQQDVRTRAECLVDC